MSLLQGSEIIMLLDVQKVNIHGSVYYQITYRPETALPQDRNALQAIRINPEAFYPNPHVGDRVEVTLLMGNIMGARKL